MIDKRFSISLTATIAELYETQKHYYAAYIVYWFLYQTEKREEYRTKLDEIREKIYKDNELNFDPLISELFSEKEVQDLGILPKSLYKQFAEADADLQRDERDNLLSIDNGEKPELQQIGKSIGLELKQIIDEEKVVKEEQEHNKRKIKIDTTVWEGFKASDLVDFLSDLKGKDRNLAEVKLSELIESFLSKYADNTSKRRVSETETGIEHRDGETGEETKTLPGGSDIES
jgi:hypothetical protein